MYYPCRNLRKILVFVLVLCCFSPPLKAKEAVRNVVVEGIAEREGMSASLASKKALEDGLKKAILEIIAYYVNEQTMEENAELLDQRILVDAQNYVRNYQLKEEKISGNTMKVKVSAEVWLDPILQDLRTLGLLEQEYEEDKRKVEVLIAQPNRYRYVVMLRNSLQDETEGIDEVLTSVVSKSHVQLTLILGTHGPQSSIDGIQAFLEASQLEGKGLKVERIGNERLQVYF